VFSQIDCVIERSLGKLKSVKSGNKFLHNADLMVSNKNREVYHTDEHIGIALMEEIG
jgi:hypothetical protein